LIDQDPTGENSRISKEYLKTARTFLRVAQNIADQAISDRLKALAEDYERRAEQASQLELQDKSAQVAAHSE
jgi:hypothetical protein